MGIHIKIFNDAQWDVAKQALSQEEHNLIVTAESEVQKLLVIVQAKYPALVSAFQDAFKEIETDTTVSGFGKMVKVVEGLLPKVPELAAELADLPHLKDLLLALGQTLFSDAITALETAAGNLVHTIFGK